jgi:hypothetical protein
MYDTRTSLYGSRRGLPHPVRIFRTATTIWLVATPLAVSLTMAACSHGVSPAPELKATGREDHAHRPVSVVASSIAAFPAARPGLPSAVGGSSSSNRSLRSSRAQALTSTTRRYVSAKQLPVGKELSAFEVFGAATTRSGDLLSREGGWNIYTGSPTSTDHPFLSSDIQPLYPLAYGAVEPLHSVGFLAISGSIDPVTQDILLNQEMHGKEGSFADVSAYERFDLEEGSQADRSPALAGPAPGARSLHETKVDRWGQRPSGLFFLILVGGVLVASLSLILLLRWLRAKRRCGPKEMHNVIIGWRHWRQVPKRGDDVQRTEFFGAELEPGSAFWPKHLASASYDGIPSAQLDAGQNLDVEQPRQTTAHNAPDDASQNASGQAAAPAHFASDMRTFSAFGRAVADVIRTAPIAGGEGVFSAPSDDPAPADGGAAPGVSENPGPSINEMPSGSTVDAGVALAKKYLTTGQARLALKALAPALHSPAETGEAWTVAGWAWWRIAQGQSVQLRAATEAAHAFTRAIALEPDRLAYLSRSLARCNLLRAQHLQGTDRAASLDDAIQAFGRSDAGSPPDVNLVIARTSALYERALFANPKNRVEFLDRAEQSLEGSIGQTAKENEQLNWMLAHIWMARAELTDANSADKLNARAAEILKQGARDLPEDVRETWLSRLIELEVSRANRLKGAARNSRFKELQESLRSPLGQAKSTMPLLLWIKALRDWSNGLHGQLAHAKLLEAEQLLFRVEALSPDEAADVLFSRAYYSRLRSKYETGAQALETLAAAERLLGSVHSPRIDTSVVSLETAEVHLARGRLLEGREAKLSFEHAAHLAEGVAGLASENESIALVCAITAHLCMNGTSESPSALPSSVQTMAERLVTITPTDKTALRLAAEVKLLVDQPAAASELCDAAWRAGAAKNELVPVWKRALAHWAKLLAAPDNDAQWTQAHRRLRLALSEI